MDLSRLLPADSAVGGVLRVVLDASAPAPPLAGMAAGASGWSESDGVIRIAPALLDTIADVVAAGAEQRSARSDKHGRVPAEENALVKSRLDRELVLQAFAARFREAAVRMAESRPVRLLAPWPAGHRWAVGLSHDLDVVAWWGLFTGYRTIELLRHADFGRLARSWWAALRSVHRNAASNGVAQLLALEGAAQVPSTWFVLCGTPTFATFAAGDLTYHPESARARIMISRVGAAGHEIGLHGSFETSRRPAAFAEQRDRLATLTGSAATGVRQHFVKLRPGSTHQQMAASGFAYDASMGFSDRNGFRLGVADVVPAWSAAEERPLDLDLVPFAWMDRALSKYSGIEQPLRWVSDGMELAERCQAAEGLWAGIWHPNLVPPMGFPDAPEANAALIGELKSRNPWFATHRDLTAWRRARRSAMAVAVDGAGKVTARTSAPSPLPLDLESPSRDRLEPVESPR